MVYEKTTVRSFENAWLNKDFSTLSEKEFATCYDEYIDTTGGYISDFFDKVVYIRLTQNRINTISNFVSLQQIFFEEYGQPYTEKFDMLLDYGYSFSWNDDKKNFYDQLESVLSQEVITSSDLKISIKEYEELVKNEPRRPAQTQKDKRQNWMNTVNSLVKLGYHIDKDRMMVEEISFIIKYEKEQALKNGR